jgi:glucose-6-phosphate-specific signal transduction histidine kinase
MKYSENEKAMMYNNEVLWAKYEIRECYLKNIAHEIYENIGQQLSLLRVQLKLLGEGSVILREKIEASGELTGQVIRDFRYLCKGFNPESEYLEVNGLLPTLENELRLLHFNASDNLIRIKGPVRNFTPGTELIVYRMLQELLTLIKEKSGKDFSITINYTTHKVDFNIEYEGLLIETDQPYPAVKGIQNQRMSLLQRAELLGGQLAFRKIDLTRVGILLIVPF